MTPATASNLLLLESLLVGGISTIADTERLAARVAGLPLNVRESLLLALLHANRALARIAPAVALAVEIQLPEESPFVGEIT